MIVADPKIFEPSQQTKYFTIFGHISCLKLTTKAPENGWLRLEDDPFLLGSHLFRCELLVSGRVS